MIIHVKREPHTPGSISMVWVMLPSFIGVSQFAGETMFDLKKRNSLTLTGTREAEEFRRVAVRRKDKGATGNDLDPDADSGACGAHSCSRAHDAFSATKPNPEPSTNEDYENRKSKGSPFKFLTTPKPAHLQRFQKTGQDQACHPTLDTGNGSTNIDCRICISCVSPQICQGSPSPVRGGGGNFLNPVSAEHPMLAPNLSSSLVSRFPSPAEISTQGLSPLRETGHGPAKLSPKNRSPLMGKLRTPSPVLKKMGSFSPAKSSKSFLGLHRISSEKLPKREKKAEKSLSVPDLTVYMNETRIPPEKAAPLKSANCNGPGVDIKTPADCKLRTTDGDRLCSNGTELSPGQQNGKIQQSEESTESLMDEGKALGGRVSRYSCEWNKVTAREESCHLVSQADNNEEDREKMKESGGSESKSEDDKEQKLYRIANELLQTERTYVARLHLVDQVFCLRLTQEADRGSFPPDVIKNIFSNISSIYSFHSQFLLPDLENCIMHWHESPGLGKALLQHAPFLRMYADYIRNFDRAIELVRTWTERSSAFRNIIQDIQSQELCGNLTLQHHMLEPVQRVPRYEMLLKDYLKKLPEVDPDYELANKSLEAVSMAAIHSNSAIHKAENLKRLLEIYEMVGEEEVVNPANEFLKEGRLLKLAARNTSAMERHLFLFNNFLLCCCAKFSLVGQRFTVRCRIGVDGMQTQQTTNEDHSYTFQVSGKEKTLELQASSEQERDDWIKAIQEAIDVFQKKNETFKLPTKEPTEETELGRRAPRWIRDNEVTLCMTCQEPFNALTRRRHHCRACGYVVCWKCSDNKVALEYDSNRLNKVCKACYSVLAGQRAERMERKKRRMLECEAYPGSMDCVLSGFLQYRDNSTIWQEVWCVLSGTQPPFFHVYNTPQDEKPLLTVPLLSCVIEELQDQNHFSLKQSKTSHVFSCDDLDVKQNWLTVLKLAVVRSL
ncbi:FYVE, RhoGEF and PH domain-containing protein 4-like isoform X1 [Poecilia reticulata]|uniref:FYVE, RhoGEF and PH domain-containing protein 4-like isoform X1 n=1 Tax=Poecilia reticulata TaxID=8081 RepID=UPI0004A4BC95|nr:PREDICTED: FYVE, RhoGEF and PH domain-containing protein 4-like isoform X1 [Poecilia reticulata]